MRADAGLAVEAEVASLTDLGLEDLRSLWRAHFGAPPKLRSVELLRLMLAWRLQAAVFGGLDRTTRAMLARSGPVQREGHQRQVTPVMSIGLPSAQMRPMPVIGPSVNPTAKEAE